MHKLIFERRNSYLSLYAFSNSSLPVDGNCTVAWVNFVFISPQSFFSVNAIRWPEVDTGRARSRDSKLSLLTQSLEKARLAGEMAHPQLAILEEHATKEAREGPHESSSHG